MLALSIRGAPAGLAALCAVALSCAGRESPAVLKLKSVSIAPSKTLQITSAMFISAYFCKISIM
jgi:hypothetical protein